VFVHEGLSTAFLGDLAYEIGGRFRASGWLTSYDTEQVQASLRSLATRTDRLAHVCPGHGPIPEDGDRKLRAVGNG
jgi:glyoxylase-like metal-dependent hydrolase (beta-lactamase superfamily II)